MVERPRDLVSRRIALRVQDAAAAVRALAPEGQPRAFPVELGAPLDELLDGRGPLFDQGVDGRLVAQPVASRKRILLVQFHFVVVA